MLQYANPRLLVDTQQLKTGHVCWRSPSNLAIIKYWGKYGNQLPQNPSISFTLQKAYTETRLEYSPKTTTEPGPSLDFIFDDKPNEAFRAKVLDYLKKLDPIFPFLGQLHLKIRSFNSFPHSAGIASSASAMSALALCLCSLEHQLFGSLPDDEAYRQKASFVARLGSGSACRSIYATMALWGESAAVEGSSNEFAIPFSDALHAVFHNFHDAILIVSRQAKQVSSRAGHALMEANAYADARYQQARQRMNHLLQALRSGDLETFGTIAENEALTLHALMMASNASFTLLHPHSLILMEKVRVFRSESKLPLYFSFDAGPNMHLLYPDHIADQVQAFIEEELSPFCEQSKWIADRVGAGPLQLD